MPIITLITMEKPERNKFDISESLSSIEEDQGVPSKKNADVIAGNIQDGHAVIKISDDELSVSADFHPPIGKGLPLDPEYIEKMLQAEGVTDGIKWEIIKDTIFTCNTDHRIFNDVIIAEGIKPRKEVPGYIRMEEKFFEVRKEFDQKSNQFDYKSLSPYIIAKKNEKLGHFVSGRKGETGKTVTGKDIPFVGKNIIQFIPGENIVTGEKDITALCDGRFILSGDKFWIEQVLQISGGVDYHTGNIKFPGDVILNGPVADGFLIYSGGSIVSKITIDASEIIAVKNLVSEQGIIGRKEGLIKAGGDIKAKFIENCVIKARGSVIVEDSILLSDISTLNRIELGDNGRLIGGVIWAINGIDAWRIGNNAYQATRIFCGEDFVIRHKLEQVNKKLIEVTLKLQAVNKELVKESTDALIKKRDNLSDISGKLNSAAGKLTGKLHINMDVEIIVRDKVYPGTVIEICRYQYIVENVLIGVRFRLDDDKRRVIAEPLSG